MKINKQYLSNYSWLTSEFLIRHCILFVTTILILNEIDPVVYGRISIINNLALFIFPLLYFGSRAIYLLRFSLAKDQTETLNEFNYGFSLRILISLAYTLILLIIKIFLDIPLYVFIILLTLSIEVLDLNSDLCVAKSLNKINTIKTSFANFFYLIILLIFLAFNILDIVTLSLLYLIRSTASFCLGLYLTIKKLNIKFNFIFNYNYCIEIFKKSRLLIISIMAGTGFAFFSQLIVKYYFDEFYLGVFSVSYLILILLTSIFSNYSTAIISHTFKNHSNFSNLSTSITAPLYLSIFLSVLVWISSDQIFNIFLPDEYFESSAIVKYFTLYIILFSFRPIFEKILLAKGLNNLIAIRNFLFLIISSFISVILINLNLGLISIPLSYFISELLILIYIINHKKSNFLKPVILNSFLKIPSIYGKLIK